VPADIKMREMVQGGELGELRRVNWIITNWFRTQQYYDQGGWRATWAGEGGGVLTNQCPHQLDLVQWVCGMPSSVSAHIGLGKYHDIEVEDEVTAYLEYPNGATGIFITTTGEAPGTNRFEVVGQNGKLVSENGKLTFTKNAVSIQAAIRGDGEMSHEVRTHTPQSPSPCAEPDSVGVVTRRQECREGAELGPWAPQMLNQGSGVRRRSRSIRTPRSKTAPSALASAGTSTPRCWRTSASTSWATRTS